MISFSCPIGMEVSSEVELEVVGEREREPEVNDGHWDKPERGAVAERGVSTGQARIRGC
jgi:hypothetical protein